MKRWLVLVAGVVLQTVLGGVYAWSAFVPALTDRYGLTNGQCGLIFGVTLAVFTLSMIPAGRLLQTRGPRLTAATGAALFSLGYLVASFSNGSFSGILIGIGCLTGAGIGAGYVCPLTVAMKWFPRNRGLVTGVAVAGFGGGAVLLSFLTQYLLNQAQWDVLQIFRLVGIGLGGVALAAALMLSEPDEATGRNTESEKAALELAPQGSGATFALICLGMFAGTFAGLFAVGNLKPIMLGAGLDSRAATLAIAVFACGNAAGRVIWGQAHDRLGSRQTILLSLGTLGIALIPMALKLPAIWMLVTAAVSGLAFGACFVVYASSVVEHFGVKRMPRLYPFCFLGYGLAGLIAPGVGGWIADATGSFMVAIVLSVAIVLLSLVIMALRFPRTPAERTAHWRPERTHMSRAAVKTAVETTENTGRE